MKCKNCGNDLPDGAIFCDSCGQKIVQSQQNTGFTFCGNCGAKIQAGEEFCGNCGCAISGGVIPTEVSYTVKNRSKAKVFIIIVIAICLAVGAAVLVYSIMQSDKSADNGTVTESPTSTAGMTTDSPPPTGTAEPAATDFVTPIPTEEALPAVTYLPQSEIATPDYQAQGYADGYASGYANGYADGGSQSSSKTNVVTATYYVVNCNEYITLRSSPSTSASEITKIPLGQAVGYIENAGNGFYKVNYNGSVGYALASYLSASKESASSSSSYTVAQVVNAKEFITLREHPSTSASEITKIPANAYVNFIRNADNGFYYVEYNGMRGYALASYLEIK